MLKRDKNKFIDVIKQVGFEPSSFKRHEKDDIDGEPAFIIQLKNSPMFFMTRTNHQNYHEHDTRYIEFSPNFPKSDYYPAHGWDDIDGVLESFEYWLNRHVKIYLEELDESDLWEQLEGKTLFNSDPMSNRKAGFFTKPEKDKIKQSLENFKESIKLEFTPTKDQLNIIQDRIDYLSGSLDRLNKTDWQGIALSTVISISIALSLDTEKGRVLFSLFKESFTAALGFIQ